MLKGRLGLETARVPHADRHGALWLSRGRLHAEDGTLHFVTAGDGDLPSGDYSIAFQTTSFIVLQPGCSVTHDALRLLARHGTGLIVSGENGIRFYASMPSGTDESARARRQALTWSDPQTRVDVARRMYALRLGEILPDADIAVLRGIEGARMKEAYRLAAQQFGIEWSGRRYDRSKPEASSLPNQAINHAASAVEAAAMIAVSMTSTLPQLGFIHEDSANAFCLDIADLYRDRITLPAAFGAVRECTRSGSKDIERATRKLTGKLLREHKLIPTMIDVIKELLDGDDGRHHA